MSAFMVGKDHIDAIVAVALHGPKDRASGWEGGPRWAAFDPRETPWREQEWRQCVLHNGTGNASVVAITPDQLGEMLWTENERSLEARYPRDHAEMLGVDYCLGYTYQRQQPRRLTIVEAFSAIACLEYQSCEHDGWTDSEAYRFLSSLKESLIGVLPGYAAAAWEVDFSRDSATA